MSNFIDAITLSREMVPITIEIPAGLFRRILRRTGLSESLIEGAILAALEDAYPPRKPFHVLTHEVERYAFNCQSPYDLCARLRQECEDEDAPDEDEDEIETDETDE